MKMLMRNTVLAMAAIMIAAPALACTISLKGYSQLKFDAVFAALDENSEVLSVKDISDSNPRAMKFEAVTKADGVTQVRQFKLEDTGMMCPEIVATEIPPRP